MFYQEEAFQETAIGKIPKEWDCVSIKQISEVHRGASPRPIGSPKYFSNKGRGWVRISDVTETYKYLRRTSQYLSELGESKSVKVDPGDLIMSICATIGKPIIIDMKACIHDGFVVFRELSNRVNTEFLFYVLQKYERKFSRMRQTGTQGNLNTGLVGRTQIPLPPTEEQEKSAEVLSIVDMAIQKTDEVIAKTERLKKGLMQQLFSKGIRHRNFKKSRELDHSIPESWEVVKLDNVAYIKGRIGWRGLKSSEYTDTGPYLIALEHIVNQRINWDTCDHLSMFRYEESPEIQLQANDIIMSKDGVHAGEVSFIDYLPDKATINSTMMLIRAASENLTPRFLFYFLQSLHFMRFVRQKTAGSAIPHIFQRDMKNLSVCIPPLNEQTSITRVLCAIDNKLGLEREQKVVLERIKQGLMGLLLSGKIRIRED